MIKFVAERLSELERVVAGLARLELWPDRTALSVLLVPPFRGLERRLGGMERGLLAGHGNGYLGHPEVAEKRRVVDIIPRRVLSVVVEGDEAVRVESVPIMTCCGFGLGTESFVFLFSFDDCFPMSYVDCISTLHVVGKRFLTW